jgi:hypothetical protein
MDIKDIDTNTYSFLICNYLEQERKKQPLSGMVGAVQALAIQCQTENDSLVAAVAAFEVAMKEIYNEVRREHLVVPQQLRNAKSICKKAIRDGRLLDEKGKPRHFNELKAGEL